MTPLDILHEKHKQAIIAYSDDRELELECHAQMIWFDQMRPTHLGIPSWSFEKWENYINKDIRMLFAAYTMREALAKEVRSMNLEGFQWYFITVGYDDENITVDKIRKYSLAVANSKYLDDVKYVNEKFRKNDKGEIYVHHHTHFLVKCELPRSRVIDKVYATVNKVVKGKNFVDVKSSKDRVGSYQDKLKYINGDKQESKMECVRLDRIWRSENNL